MAAQTGRTVSKHVDFRIHDSGATLRSIPVNSINGVGVVYDEVDVTAWQDAIKNALTGHGDAKITISGVFDTSEVAPVGTLSGSHTVLSGIVGGLTPLSLDIQIGIRHAWESGEPQFGITKTSTSGYICSSYTVNLDDMTYSATFIVIGGVAPAWGTSAES